MKRGLLLFALLCLTACSGARAVPNAPATTTAPPTDAAPRSVTARSSGGNAIVFHAYDANGARLSWSAFRTLQENGHGTNGDNDVVLDPATLRVKTMWPLYQSGTDPALTLPSGRSSLALAWPTSDGYSNLIVDLPTTAGTYVFNLLAARQVVADLNGALASRVSYAPSAAAQSAIAAARSDLAAANAATAEAQQGALGAKSLDEAVHAELLVLQEAGLSAARSAPAGSLDWGVTFDDISQGSKTLTSVQQLYGSDGWIRIVFDRSEQPAYYAAEIAAAKNMGLHVVGQILDSSDMRALSMTAWQQRVASYVSAFPALDEWEVGNEINGKWLGTDVASKVAYAAGYVKQHARGRTLATLFWQLGEDDAAHSMFTWAGANLSAVISGIDDLGISLYPENSPMGSAFERVMTTLHAQYPSQRLMVTELDYWSSDLTHTWWWGSSTDPLGAGRTAVATLYQSAVLAYPYSGGGTFWWYFVEECAPGSPLWNALHALHAQAM